MTEVSPRDLNAAQIVSTCTMPVVGALLFVAFGVVERAQVDPSASLFSDTSFSRLPDVWYPALIIFGCLHALGHLVCHRGELIPRALGTFLFLLPFAFLNLINAPVTFGMFVGTLLGVTLIGIVIAAPVAIAAAGAFSGFLLFLPLYIASGLMMRDEPREIAVSWKAYIGGGIFAALVFSSAFGVFGPASTPRIGVGRSVIDPADLNAAWLYVSLAIALCCSGFCLGSMRFWEKRSRSAMWLLAIWFLAPVAVVITLTGSALEALASSPIYRAVVATEPLNRLSLFFREGAPRRSEPLHFKAGEWLMPRERLALVHYVNGSPFATRLMIRPRPEDVVTGEIEVSQLSRSPDDARASWLGTSACDLDKGRLLLLCQSYGPKTRIPGTRSYFPQSSRVIEIDSESPARDMRYDAFWLQNCTVRLSDVRLLGFSAEFKINCAQRLSWRQIAIGVENDLASSYRSKSGSAERSASQ